jgi:hypothetical protein
VPALHHPRRHIRKRLVFLTSAPLWEKYAGGVPGHEIQLAVSSHQEDVRFG